MFDASDLLEEVGFYVESEELQKEVVDAFADQEWCERDYFSLDPTQRLWYGWKRFEDAVKHKRRFTFWSMEDDKSEFDEDYMPVGEMLALIGRHVCNAGLVKTEPKGKAIWRVRVHDIGVRLALDHELSPPPAEKALQANRMSPAGVVMFYGAEDFETACAETVDSKRAVGKSVTGAIFRSSREMQFLDLVNLPDLPSYFKLGTSEIRQILLFLRNFARDIAQPIARDGREHIEYVPPQAFAEYLRFELKLGGNVHIDGIRYRSSVNGQPCYVLFCTQDECIADSPHSRDRWLEFDAASLRTVKAQDAKPSN